MALRHRSQKNERTPDYFLLVLVVVLTIFGLAMLVSASSEIGKAQFNDSYYYLKHQALYGLSLGVLGFFFTYKFPYRFYRKLALPFLFISLVLLVLVFTKFGIEAHSAKRWIQIGPINLQPAELLKITFVLYLAAWLSSPHANREKNFYEGLLPFLIISGAVTVLLVLQPATSVVVILMSAGLVIYFISGAPFRYIASIILCGLLGLGLLIYITPYRWQRVSGYLNSQKDSLGVNYHVNQALIAVGSGGLWGRGYGQSTTKVRSLPEPIDDSIFAVIAEELGFIGAGGLVVVFGLLVFRLFWLARKSRDKFGRLILAGFGTIIAFQSFINIAAISGLAPLTGVPLPFISYGGTALAVFLTMAGISANISKYV